MQVLKDSKVKFVSAIAVSLLTSFWLCLWFSHNPGPIVLLLVEKGEALHFKKWILNLPNQCCKSVWILCAEGDWASFFSFL